MENNGPFGFDPDEFDRVLRDASEGLRDAFGKFLSGSQEKAGLGILFDEFTRRSRPQPRPEPETAGEAGDGVWAIFIVDGDGKAHVEQVYRNSTRCGPTSTTPTRAAASGSCPTGSMSACSTPERSRTPPTTTASETAPSSYIVSTMR